MTQTRRPHPGYEAAAVCGMLAGPVLLVGSVAATLAQPDEFSFIEHATSDLGAETANAPWISNQLTSNLPGLLVAVFSVGLWHMLGRHRSARIRTFLIGLVGVGLFLTGIFTVDCREIDAGCSSNDVSRRARRSLERGSRSCTRAGRLTLRRRSGCEIRRRLEGSSRPELGLRMPHDYWRGRRDCGW